jgi:hypothetical protein
MWNIVSCSFWENYKDSDIRQFKEYIFGFAEVSLISKLFSKDSFGLNQKFFEIKMKV